MILSTKGRYAVMAMVDLASREADAPVTLAQIAEDQEIPLAYLEQIFARLKKAHLVKAVRGPRGGYLLARSPSCLNVAEIILAADESIEMTRCKAGRDGKGGCVSSKSRCLTHDLWHGLTQHIHDYLEAISLADVCSGELPLIPAAKNANLIQVVQGL